MQQLNDFADSRLINGCIYCGGPQETREHVPSKIFLNKPFPENLPVMPACRKCNNDFSLDEEYVACLIGCMKSKSTNPEKISDKRVSKTLKAKPRLKALFDSIKHEENGVINFQLDEKRLKKIIHKLALGHASFELSTVLREEPEHIDFWLLFSMRAADREDFNSFEILDKIGEVGSRKSQRPNVVEMTLINKSTGEPLIIPMLINDWIEVQEGKYRYHTIEDGSTVSIKIVFSEFLACQVTWLVD
ncbi:HNH endonuclease 5 domain-containing protein [uncultured Thiomicrorhabdus sp.]